jgi:hypothetical protein
MDIDEFVAGTNPMDAQDLLSVTQFQLDAIGAHAKSFGQKGRYYFLQRSTNLVSWSEVTRSTTLGSPQSLDRIDSNPPPPASFYDIRAVLP